MTSNEPAFAGNAGVFTPGELVWALETDGPRYGQAVWDFAPLITRMSQSERRIDFVEIPDGYRADATDLLMVLAQPDHPAVVEAGVVRRDGPAPTYSVYCAYICLRTLARWGTDRSLPSFAAWRQQDCDRLLADLQTGRHRKSGHGLSPGTICGYVELLKLLRDCQAVLPQGLAFRPWGARSAANVSGYIGGVENETAPLGWGLWAPLLTASWAIVDKWSADIVAAVHVRRNLPSAPGGPAGTNAVRIIEAWDANGGKLPLHTGFGRSHGQRGEANTNLLCRQLGIHDSILYRANHNYRQDSVDRLAAAAVDPKRGVLGGVVEPSCLITHENGTRTQWVAEIGLGETEYLASVLRAACYIIVGSLTGMRDGEIQELRRDAVTTRDGLPALASIEHKGNDSLEGEARAWWAPQPVIRACEVLAAVSPHPDYLFARDATNAGSYASDRDLPRLIAFVNGDPATRPGRGSGLGLSPIDTTGSESINAVTLRRSFAVYATTKPGAELGLGIQLGHSAWRMTSGYFSDGQQQAVKHLDATRKSILRKEVAALITDTAPIAGPAAGHITAFRAQVIADPSRADHIAATVADRYHFGITNDCMWNVASSGCGPDGPHLNDHICIGPSCFNALLRQAHTPVLQDGISRIDAYLNREGGKCGPTRNKAAGPGQPCPRHPRPRPQPVHPDGGMMPAKRKRVSDDVLIRVSDAIEILSVDQNAPRTKRQIEILSGLGHDAVARAFRQDATEPDNAYRLNEKFNHLIAPLGTGRRSPAGEEKHQDKQKIAELKQQVSELNRQLDRYAMTLFAYYLEDNPHTEADGAVSIRRHRRQRH